MILTSPTPDGYIFNQCGEVIGVGTYTEEDFFLLETDNTTSTHSNGMAALGYNVAQAFRVLIFSTNVGFR